MDNYFEFISEDCIRIAETRVGIEIVLNDYQEGAGPEEIALRYPSLTLEQVHATITYYLANREKLDAYLDNYLQEHERACLEQKNSKDEFIVALRERLERRR